MGYRILDWKEKMKHSDWRPLIPCAHCPSECRFDFKRHSNGGIIIFFTSWHDFGSNPAPLDKKWKCFMDNKELPRVGRTPKFEFDVGSICAAFEHG